MTTAQPPPPPLASPLADGEARRIIREDLGSTVVVEAAAGTGKTTALVARVVGALAAGDDVGRIAVVTFTEKAAGELKLRLRAELERARRAAPSNVDLEEAVKRLEEAMISTIHAFCADLLRERPVEAGLDPAFEALSEEESEDLFGEAFDAWFEEVLAAPPPAIRKALRRRGDEGPVATLRTAARELARHADLDAAWTEPTWDREASTQRVVLAAQEVLARARGTSSEVLRDHVFARLVEIAEVDEENLGPLVADDLEAAIVALVRPPHFFRDPPRARGKGVAEVLDALRALEREAIAFTELADAELAARLREDLRPAVTTFQERKAARGALDFDDLLLRTLALLRTSGPARGALQRRFDRLYVDEFQDTDAVQSSILLLLAADDPAVAEAADVQVRPGKLFLVGDPKQSIYRFRRADLATYFVVRDRLARGGAERVELGTSFRAVPSIQGLVNAAFAPVMTEDREALSPGYVPLVSAGATDPEDQPAVIALPVPQPYGRSGRITLTAVRASQPHAVGAFVAWLLGESGFLVRDPGTGERVPVAPRHVCLLFRYLDTKFQGDVGNAFAGALSARGVPVVLVGGKALFDREETLAVVAAAGAVERPGDENEVYQTLRGPLFALTDDVLLDWRSRFLRLDPRRLPITALPQHLEPVADVLQLLGDLHRGRRRRTPVETIERLLASARAHVTLALRPSGEQALSNVAAVLEVARREERRGALSFRAFVDRLREEVERRRTPEPPLLEDESDAVRLMTVHKAKGLEFPVVILADPTPNASPREVSRVVEPAEGRIAFRVAGALPLDVVRGNTRELARERAESTRLAYVAATRARDLLVVPIVGDSPVFPAEGWLAPLQRALVPPEGARPAPSPGCPTFGRDSVLREEGDVPSEATLTPGTYTSEGGARFTVWDPAVLALRAPPSKGLRRVDLVLEGTPQEVVTEGRDALASFRAARAACLARGAAPTERVVTATAVSHAEEEAEEGVGGGLAGTGAARATAPPSPDAAQVALESLPREAGRPRGPRFGELVHHLLAVAPLDRGADLGEAAREEARVRGRLLGLDAEAIAAATRAATAALDHPHLRAAAQALTRGECRREASITHVLDETRILEGVVDLAYRSEVGWTVVDFKTDAELTEERRAAYARQVALYVEAIHVATGEPARGVLLLV